MFSTKLSMESVLSNQLFGDSFDISRCRKEFEKAKNFKGLAIDIVGMFDAIANKNSLSISSNDNNSIIDSTESKEDSKDSEFAIVHHLWQGHNVWTTGEEDACFWNAKQTHYSGSPVLTVIEPNCVKNVNLLGRMPNMEETIDSRYQFGGKKSKKTKVGIFKDFVFFSQKATDSFCRKLGSHATTLDSQNVYQFEARFFQYSVLRCNIRFVKDYRNVEQGKEYLVFKFGRSAKVGTAARSDMNGVDLYAICEENNMHNQQPWYCQHIFTLHEMLRFFKVDKASSNVQNGFLEAMRINDDCVKTNFNPSYEWKRQSTKIEGMLTRGYREYSHAMRSRDGSTSYYEHSPSVSSISVASETFGSVPPSLSLGGGWASNSLVTTSSIGAMSAVSSVSSRSYNDTASVRSNSGNYGRFGRGKGQKIKNEDKFGFLEQICAELGLRMDESGRELPRRLLAKLGEAIDNAYLFAQRHPETVLTQAYIDEDHGSIAFELVLLAEIADEMNEKFFKFAVPIVECSLVDGKRGYKAENILTPKMVIDNVRLNSANAEFKEDTWIARIEDVSFSFYEQVDTSWYRVNSQYSSGCRSECDQSEYENSVSSDSMFQSVKRADSVSLFEAAASDSDSDDSIIDLPPSMPSRESVEIGSLSPLSINRSRSNNNNNKKVAKKILGVVDYFASPLFDFHTGSLMNRDSYYSIGLDINRNGRNKGNRNNRHNNRYGRRGNNSNHRNNNNNNNGNRRGYKNFHKNYNNSNSNNRSHNYCDYNDYNQYYGYSDCSNTNSYNRNNRYEQQQDEPQWYY